MLTNIGDTAWVLVCTALVMMMTPALGMFYSGMTRGKNALATMMQSVFTLALIAIQWTLIGYTLSFGPSIGGWIGGLSWIGLEGVGADPVKAYASSIPHLAFALFQMMFAVITPALITGAWAERLKFSAFVVFTLLWATLVYDPIAHWMWSCTPVKDAAWLNGCAGTAGMLRRIGALDFAGGLVVHVSAGFSALAAALALGRRHGFGRIAMVPHDISLTMVGTALLWLGWIGFNGGAAMSANGVAANAVAVTIIAAAAAMVSSTFASWRFFGKPSVLAAASGAVAGMVASTPAAGYVSPLSGVIIGFVAGFLCFMFVLIREKVGIDDSLDVFAVHGVGGVWGALSVGIFGSLSVNQLGGNGLLNGNAALIGHQAVAIGVIGAYSFVVSFVLLKLINFVFGLRVSREEEEAGLDVSVHGEMVEYRVNTAPPTVVGQPVSNTQRELTYSKQ